MRIDEASKEMQDILSRCESNQLVPLSEIKMLPEIKNAEARLTVYAQELAKRIESLTGIKYSVENIDTTLYPSAERLERRSNALKKLQNMGSAVIESEKKTEYNGVVKRDGHLDIVIGLPASGKSSAIVDTLSQFYNARIVDNDEAKKLLAPEYNNGYGANLVHLESQQVSEKQMIECFAKHENVVIPKVGSGYDSIEAIVTKARKFGYKDINIHYVDLPRNKAMGRLLRRFITDDRYLPPALIDKYCNSREGNKIQKTYDMFKKGGNINGYAKWNNDIKRGEAPILEESKGIEEIDRIQSMRTGLVLSGPDRRDGIESDLALQGGNRDSDVGIRRAGFASADLDGIKGNEGTRVSESRMSTRPSVLGALKEKQKIVDQYKADKANQPLVKSNGIEKD